MSPTDPHASPTSPDRMLRRPSQQSPSGTSTKRPLEDFDLPPPPTRTRKIIQINPQLRKKPQSLARSKGIAKQAQTLIESKFTGSKEKLPNAERAAGRKLIRKMAHSLIERRRRSKMNEEFDTLKDMVPACRGHRMHRLDILQASIDYVDYLERCISDLKTAGTNHLTKPPAPKLMAGLTAEDDLQQPLQRAPPSVYSDSTSKSPEIMPGNDMPLINTLPGAAFAPRSPALGPQVQFKSKLHDNKGIDHEDSALLMLDQNRRRTAYSVNEHFANKASLSGSASVLSQDRSTDGRQKRGMSVRDLLIS